MHYSKSHLALGHSLATAKEVLERWMGDFMMPAIINHLIRRVPLHGLIICRISFKLNTDSLLEWVSFQVLIVLKVNGVI